MITLRMLGIASAILVGIPLAIALADGNIPTLVPGGEVFDFTADAAAGIFDLALIEPPETYDRVVNVDGPEQLVEGHTVFITWDIPIIPNVTNWTLDIVGNVDCEVHHNESGVFFGPVPIPTRVNSAYAECHAAGRGFVTPDPFVPHDQSYRTPLFETGNEIPFTTPTGEHGVATEYVYSIITKDWMGTETATPYYAWSAPYVTSWTHTDGKQRAWYCPMPIERLMEMGVDNFHAYTESEMAGAGFVLAG